MSTKTDKLRAAVDAMTPGEWVFVAPSAPAGAVDIFAGRLPSVAWPDLEPDDADVEPVCEWVQECLPYMNASAICALRNHATALLDVAAAAQAYLAANCAQTMGDQYLMDRADANFALKAALARLENIP